MAASVSQGDKEKECAGLAVSASFHSTLSCLFVYGVDQVLPIPPVALCMGKDWLSLKLLAILHLRNESHPH